MINLPDDIKNQLYAQLSELSNDSIFILDAKKHYIHVNASFERMIGMSQANLIGRYFSIYEWEKIRPDTQKILSNIDTILDEEGYYEGFMELSTRNRTKINLQLRAWSVQLTDKLYYVGTFRDAKPSENIPAPRLDLLTYDSVTKLPNREYFFIQFTDLLLDTYQELVLIRLNFDRFRLIKHTFSKKQQYDLLKEFVNRVISVDMDNLRLFSRFSSDDFALLFEAKNAQLVRNDLDKLMRLTELPYFIGQDHVYLHFSAGVSHFPKQGRQVNILLENAEKAMHYVKDKGGDDIFWYTEELNHETVAHLRIESEIRKAIENKEFFPVYQPKVDLTTSEIIGFEALVRWQHPIRGVLAPDQFLESIVEHKLSFELFRQMAQQVFDHMEIWQKQGFDHSICVNADASEILHPQLTSFLEDMLKKYNVDQHSLHIEVTEMTLMRKHNDIRQRFMKLKELGICLALDDFGTGYASISYLQHYPFDYLKIDKSFVNDIESDTTQQHIVKAIIDLADALCLKTVVEGIETQQQSKLMKDLGCQFAQGYYYGKAMSFAEADKRLKNNQKTLP